MIEVKVKLLHTDNEVKFLLPAMFIEFETQKPAKQHTSAYGTRQIFPYHQFSNSYLAMEILPFERYFEDGCEVAAIFARSRKHEGYIYLRYKHVGEVELETIKPWRLFMSYLLSKDK
jgi:hypothetical protein